MAEPSLKINENHMVVLTNAYSHSIADLTSPMSLRSLVVCRWDPSHEKDASWSAATKGEHCDDIGVDSCLLSKDAQFISCSHYQLC